MFEQQEQNPSNNISPDHSLASEAVYDYFVRVADLDDLDHIKKQIQTEEQQKLNLLFAYPNLLKLFEKSFISVTILDRNHTIVGAACFNDFPQGLQGKFDHQHQNLWEGWFSQAFNTEKMDITSHNTLWMTFMFVNEQNKPDYQLIMERVFQNIYAFRPEISGILFLKRSEIGERQGECDILLAVKNLFLRFKKTKSQVLKQVIGVSIQSEIFYSTKLQVTQTMEIRMAKQQDHDDLAQIFNSQSDVLTSQFGQFFIADLIATQNLTRRMTKGSQSQGKAIVGQVRDKAVGLMSISTQIDYELLNNCFQLDLYDSLIKSDLMEAINTKRRRILQQKQWQREDELAIKKSLVQQQFVKCTKIGQRILLQQYCLDKQIQIKNEIELIMNNDQTVKTLDRTGFMAIINKFMQGHSLCFPSQRLLQFPNQLRKLQTFIVSPTQFLIQTLQIFGLPKNYIDGNGHWKDWAKKIQEQKRTRQLRRPAKKGPTRPQVARKGKQTKQDDQKPPSYFDMTPFKEAFNKFLSTGAEIRTILREEILDKRKKIVMRFCDKDGQMLKTNSVDLGSLAKIMGELGFEINVSALENLHSILQAFGGIKYQESVVQMIAKQEEDPKKKMFLIKKADNQPPKMMDVTLRMTNYEQFIQSIQTIKYFDLKLAKLGYLKSPRLQIQLKQILQSQKNDSDAIAAKRSILPDYGTFDVIVNDISSESQFPQIPYQSQNAIVINLFCMDEVYEARSLEFVEYAFNLFPERDYIILTQPFSVPESILLQNFIQINKKKNSTFQHCLYIFHRDSLLSTGLQIRRSRAEDLPKAQYILNNMLHSQKIKADIIQSLTNTSSRLIPFTVTCGSEVIGMYVVSKAVNLDYYVSHFFIQDHIILNQHPKECHTKLVHAILNPLFQKSVRFILREILRLLNKTCMYFQVHERTLLPDIFHEFVLVRTRVFPHFLRRKWDVETGEEDVQRRLRIKGAVDNERNPFDQTQPPFSLSMITKKLLHSQKVSNNNRIVVVGASDTGISFIESLLSIKQINFTNITLLAPGGLLTMHVKKQKQLLKTMSTSYNLQQFKNLMIDARTTVLDTKMVKLDKKNRRIMLDTNAYVPFDILVIAVGLIDTQLQNQGLISYGLSQSPYYKDKKYVQGVYSIDDPYLYRQFSIGSKNIQLLNRRKKPANITIYGRTPHTISFITGLIERGVDPKRIYFVTPNSNRPRMRTFTSNTERLAYEESLVNDPDSFEDPNVEKIVFEQLISLGINVNLGFQYYEMIGNPCQMIRFRKKASNYDQLQQQIKQKRIEIQLNLQQMGNKIQDDYQSEDSDAEERISPQQQIEKMQQLQYIELQTPCNFFVTSGLIDIDREIFNIIHENGLVYNGRLIVKSNFQTTESEIFACGKICEFSQRYKNHSIGKSLRLDKYNGRQLGRILSKHVLEKLDLSYLTTQNYSEQNLPKLYMPLGCGGALPGKLVYYFIRKNDYSQPKAVYQKQKEKGEQYRQIKSDNIRTDTFEGHYIRFMIDSNNLIDSVSYLGSQEIVVQSLMSFVGLSVNYLNKLTSRYEHGLIENISEFLSENWAICIYHELFSEFRHYIKNQLLNHPVADRLMNRASDRARQGENVSESFFNDIKAIIPQDLINLVRQGAVSFIQINSNHLPMYYLPRSKVKTV